MVRGFCKSERTAGQRMTKPSAAPSTLSKARWPNSRGVSLKSPVLTLHRK